MSLQIYLLRVQMSVGESMRTSSRKQMLSEDKGKTKAKADQVECVKPISNRANSQEQNHVE